MSRKILIAGDREEMRRLLVRALERAGYKIVLIDEGSKAIRFAREGKPDAILVDLELASADGFEVIRTLKSGATTSMIPLLALTALPTKENVRRSHEAGASGLLRKADPQAIVDRIGRAIADTPTPPVEPPSPAAPPRISKGWTHATYPRVEVEEKLKSVLTLKALPFMAREIIEVTGRPSSTAQDLATVIGRDQALTTRVLQLSNSAFYTPNKKVKSLAQAVTRIGFRGVREIALAITLIKEYGQRGKRIGLHPIEFWKHSLGCAVLAKDLAAAIGGDPDRVEMAFLAGLLHDIGKPILNDLSRDAYAEIVSVAAKKETPLCEVEFDAFGLDHTEIAKYVIAKWGLPANLWDPIILHHVPWEETSRKEGADLKLIGTVWMANVLTKAMRVGSGGDETLRPIPDALAGTLGLSREKVFDLCRAVRKQVTALAQVLPLRGAGGARWLELPPEAPPPRKGADVLLLREARPAIDPLELLLERLNCRVRTGSLEETWRERPPDLVVIGATSAEWLETPLPGIQRCGGGGVRLVALTESGTPPEFLDRLRGLGASVLSETTSIAEAARLAAAD